jgi:acetyl esterase/lipase
MEGMPGMDDSLDETMPMEQQEPAAETRPAPRIPKGSWIAEGAGLAVLLLSPLYVVQVPWLWLFKLQLLLTEEGHWAAPLLLWLAWRAGRSRGRALSLLGAVLLLSPVLRAAWLAPRLRAETGLAWGGESGSPLSWARLLKPSFRSDVERTEESFDPEHGLKLSLWARRDDQGLMTARPVVLVLHGGGWDSGSRDESPAFDQAIAGLGWVVADMDYRLAPAAPWPASRQDILHALEHLRLNAKRLDVDPEHVVLLGRSAGAHLALDYAYGTQDGAVRGVIAFYGPADLRFAWQTGQADDILHSWRLLRQLCGAEPLPQGGCFDEASPYSHVNARTPPTLLLHGRVDALVSVRQSERLAQRLREEGVPHQFVELPWATHAFDWSLRSPGGQAAWYTVERFLQASERQKPVRPL